MAAISETTKTTEHDLPFSVASIVQDVLHQHGSRSSNLDFASRKVEESSLRRYEAAEWLRKTVGVIGGKDLPAEPSEEEFMLGLRSGIILCAVLNKLNPGAVSKVVEGPSDSIIVTDGAALSAFQYFENIRNFLVAVEEMGLPSFEASDLEQGGKSARVVNCVLGLKSYSLWKQAGGNGSWKLGSNAKPPSFGRPFMRKNSEPIGSSLLKTLSWGEKSVDSFLSYQSSNSDLGNDLNENGSARSLNMLVRKALSDKKQEEVPKVIESMLNKVVEEFERRLASQSEPMKAIQSDIGLCGADRTLSNCASEDVEMEQNNTSQSKTEEEHIETGSHKEGSKDLCLKQHMLVEQQHRDIQSLKHTLHDTKGRIQFLQRTYKEEFDNLGKHLHGLAYAASGYQRVLEENRKLYNQVQDLKGNIRVYCRVRPFLAGQPNRSSTVENIEDKNITITSPAKYCKEGHKSFTFNKIFGPSATQEEVFADTRPLIRSVLDGYNVCIFAYGQTGSGKTFTMTGPRELTEESHGVNYRALHDLFLLSEQRKETFFYKISVQMLEIYNEQVRDLLVMDGSNKRLEIRNSSQNGINVPEANLVPVTSPSDVLYLMKLGEKNRAVGATAMNDRSSRSHSCLTVHVQGKDLTSGTVLRGCMHLVDLAGSERVDKSEVTGDRLKEAQHINKSLSALGDVISALALRNSHVPYRNSKLTQLLQDSLGGQAKTLMFVHISPGADAAGETISTLKFAERVSTVELGAARANKDNFDVRDLKDQIASLKAALARKEGEREQLQHSLSSSPDLFRLKSTLSSPWRSLGDHRSLPMEDFGHIQNGGLNSNMRTRSVDPQEMLLIQSTEKEEDKESGSSEKWDDKIMLNKRDALNCWGDNDSEMFIPDNDPPVDDLMRTYDSDDHLEAATSDSSDLDVLWHLNSPNASSPTKTQPKPATRLQTRSLIPSLIPSPPVSRKSPNGVSQLIQPSYNRSIVRQTVHGQAKRRTSK